MQRGGFRMLYLITEGNEYSSDTKFIGYIEELYISCEYELIFSSGNRGLQGILESIQSKCNTGDTVILFFDNVEDIGGMKLKNFILTWSNNFSNKGVRFLHTTWYCFEEVFLSYEYLVDLVDSKYKDMIKLFQTECENEASYILNEGLLKSIQVITGVLKTREKYSAAMLSILTKSIRGRFKIEESSLGDCWFRNCKNYFNCRDCSYKCRLCSSLVKFEEFEKHTILKSDLTFREVFEGLD